VRLAVVPNLLWIFCSSEPESSPSERRLRHARRTGIRDPFGVYFPLASIVCIKPILSSSFHHDIFSRAFYCAGGMGIIVQIMVSHSGKQSFEYTLYSGYPSIGGQIYRRCEPSIRPSICEAVQCGRDRWKLLFLVNFKFRGHTL